MRISCVVGRFTPIVLALVVVGCGGSPAAGATESAAPTSTPVGTVNAVLQSFKDGAIDTVSRYACSAQKTQIEAWMHKQVVGSDQSETLTAMVSMMSSVATLDWIKMRLDSGDVAQTSLTGDAAVVHVKGQLSVTYQVTEGAITRTYTMTSGMPAVDNNVTLKKEGGSWLVCA